MILDSANFIAITDTTVLLTNIILFLPRVSKLSRWQKIFLSVVAIICIGYIPIYHGLSLAKIARGILGDLSISSMLLLTYILFKRIGDNKKIILMNPIFAGVVVCLGCILYLSVFGIIKLDVYRFGYFPQYILVGFVLIELCLWHFSRICAWLWIVALIAFYWQLQASANLWDYLFDPVLWFIAIFQLFASIIKVV